MELRSEARSEERSEAHHLRWDPEEPDAGWLIAKALSERTKGLLLLTATPRQKGLETQYGLLNLVDPNRFTDFDDFEVEHQKIAGVAALAGQLQEEGAEPQLIEDLKTFFVDDTPLLSLLDESTIDIDKVLKAMIDRHGTGRVLFRNRRERLKGFPKRILKGYPLEASKPIHQWLAGVDPLAMDELALMDLATGRGNRESKNGKTFLEPRMKWFCDFVENIGSEKALVLCASPERVIELQKGLEKNTSAKVAIFHENMSVVDRDKEAARFADAEGSAFLLCSEIGGEGRNFQFVSNLVLLDIPRHPDLVEQRIGRLDRIGQKKDVVIHVPWMQDTPEEVLFRWYHEGFGAFEESWNGVSTLLEYFAEDLISSFRQFLPKHESFEDREASLKSLIMDTQESAAALKVENRKSVDVLVDMNSYDEDIGHELAEFVDDHDDDLRLENFFRGMFDHYGVDYEEFDDRGSLIVKPESLMFIEKFPGISSHEETVVAFDREVALSREEISFLTLDHEMTEGALSLLLQRNEGVATICKWMDSPMGPGLIVEMSMLLEASGPQWLALGRYLPISSFEIRLNHQGRNVKNTAYKDEPLLLEELSKNEFPDDMGRIKQILEPLLAKAYEKANRWSLSKVEAAVAKAEKSLNEEIDRVEALAEINFTVSEKEVEAQKSRRELTLSTLRKTIPRLDGIRVIFTQ